MSTPFKMKGWSASPMRQNPKPNLRASLQNIQKSISNTLSGIGLKPKTVAYNPTTKKSTSGFGLTSAEKAQAKKHGMSQYQWKTEKNKSGTRANRYARDNKLGKYAKKTTSEVLKYPDKKDEITDLYMDLNPGNNLDWGPEGLSAWPKIYYDHGDYSTQVQFHHLGKVYDDLSEVEAAQAASGGKDAITYTINGKKVTEKEAFEYQGNPENYSLVGDAPTEVDYGTGMTTKDWKQESSTGWSLHELTQERKKFDAGSPEYGKIQKAINLGYKTGGPVEEKSYKEGTKENPHSYIPGLLDEDAVEGQYYEIPREGDNITQTYLFKNGKYIKQ